MTGAITRHPRLASLREAGVDLERVGEGLLADGLREFCDSYGELLECIESKVRGAVTTG